MSISIWNRAHGDCNEFGRKTGRSDSSTGQGQTSNASRIQSVSWLPEHPDCSVPRLASWHATEGEPTHEDTRLHRLLLHDGLHCNVGVLVAASFEARFQILVF